MQRVPNSAIAHVSVSSPLIPDGRISRARLAASDLHALSPQSLPIWTEAYVHAHIHPSSVWFTLQIAQGSVYHVHRPRVLPWCHPDGRSLYREPCTIKEELRADRIERDGGDPLARSAPRALHPECQQRTCTRARAPWDTSGRKLCMKHPYRAE